MGFMDEILTCNALRTEGAVGERPQNDYESKFFLGLHDAHAEWSGDDCSGRRSPSFTADFRSNKAGWSDNQIVARRRRWQNSLVTAIVKLGTACNMFASVSVR
jgi:hypothetical protein